MPELQEMVSVPGGGMLVGLPGAWPALQGIILLRAAGSAICPSNLPPVNLGGLGPS